LIKYWRLEKSRNEATPEVVFFWRQEAMKTERNFLLFQQLDYGDSSVSIQSSGGLIQKQQLWFYDQLHTNVGTLPLPTWNPTKKFRPNLQEENMKDVILMLQKEQW